MNSLSVFLKLILEFCGRIALALWAWRKHGKIEKYALVLLLPLCFALIWGTFNSLGNPYNNRAPLLYTSQQNALFIEFCLFAFVTWAMIDIGKIKGAVTYAICVIVYCLLDYQRLAWIINQQ